jgi:hypothetical protein
MRSCARVCVCRGSGRWAAAGEGKRRGVGVRLCDPGGGVGGWVGGRYVCDRGDLGVCLCVPIR